METEVRRAPGQKEGPGHPARVRLEPRVGQHVQDDPRTRQAVHVLHETEPARWRLAEPHRQGHVRNLTRRRGAGEHQHQDAHRVCHPTGDQRHADARPAGGDG